MTTACIKHLNGEPTIVVNGQPCPPMTITLTPHKNLSSIGSLTPGRPAKRALLPDSPEMAAYLDGLRETGIRIFFIEEATAWRQPGGNGQMDGVTQTKKDMELILSHIPEAWLIIRINISPTGEWVNAHPEEQVLYSDGTHRKTMASCVSSQPIDGMHSFCSKAWLRDAEPHIQTYLDEVEKAPGFDRVIGFMLCAGGTYEWYYPDAPLSLVRPDTKAYADFSEPFMEEYRQLLREKYPTLEDLRKAWNRPDATFEKPVVPDVEERMHCYEADWAIQRYLLDWHENNKAKRVNITDSDVDARHETTRGVFLNMNDYAYSADFFQAWHRGTANAILNFAKIFKKRYPNLLVGSFYSSFGCSSFYGSGNNSEVYPFLETPWIDFLASPSNYDNREPGNFPAQRGINDSFAIRDKLYFNEDDCRVQGAYPWMLSQTMGLFSIKDTITTLKRAFGHDLGDGIYSWWYDMHTGWYKDQAVLDLFKRQQEITLKACQVDRTKRHEAALLFDTESLHIVSHWTSIQALDYMRCTEIPRMGVPVDYYFHNDVAFDGMPDYKLYVVMNCYRLTTQEREAIFAKARKNNATVIWLYAPGFVNPDGETVMDVRNISETVGMHLTENDETRFPHFQVDTSHPATAKASPARRYGGIDRPVRDSVWIQRDHVHPWYLNPSFTVEDEQAIILGRYCDTGKPIMALSYKNGFPSIYCGAIVMRSDLLASIAEWAGCHRYIDTEDGLFANENFVTVHAVKDGPVTIHFKQPCTPYEVYERRFYGEQVKEITVQMYIGETHTWCVNAELTRLLDK